MTSPIAFLTYLGIVAFTVYIILVPYLTTFTTL